ncbi:hypothetical protein ACIBI9_30465 [Nonomuraea sp. NPDC050451]|uniref:hypothetical protein n=1 Tax=Nonomuraea sp. NPDC050451 TaxID=3364364 RepID=UPI0037A325DE
MSQPAPDSREPLDSAGSGPLDVVRDAYVRAGLRMGVYVLLFGLLTAVAVAGFISSAAQGEVAAIVMSALLALAAGSVAGVLLWVVVPHLMPYRSRLVRELAAGHGPTMRLTRKAHFDSGSYTNDYEVTFADGKVDGLRAALGQTGELERALAALGVGSNPRASD